MKLKLVKIGNPVLRKKILSISKMGMRIKRFRSFLKIMVTTMRHAGGVGLAANQVGENQRVFVMECQGNGRYPSRPAFPLQAYLNPRIVSYSKAKLLDWEGCLSIPGFRGKVPRSKQVTFEALTPDGRRVRKTVRGFEARVVQHEVDHLNGLFYVDRMRDLSSWTHLEEFNKKFGIKVKDKK